MRLVRTLDATGRPFRLTLARLSRWPSGLDVAIVGANAGQGARYCAETLRHTGDINLARQAHAERQVYWQAPQLPKAKAQAALPPAQNPPGAVPAPQTEPVWDDPWHVDDDGQAQQGGGWGQYGQHQ